MNVFLFLISEIFRSRLTLRSRLLYALLFGVSMAGSARAQLTGPAEEQPEDVRIGQIIVVTFQGNHALSSDELATVITTKASSSISNFLYNASLHIIGSPFEMPDFSKLQRDTAALNEYYRDHGFLDARSTYRVTADSSDVHAYFEYMRQRLMKNSGGTTPRTIPQIRDTITFQIHEGQPYTISRVAIEGLESLPDKFQPEVTEGMTIKTGERWSRPIAAKEVERLTGILIENGYPNVQEDSIVVQHTAGYRTVNVLIYFRPGHRYRYGPVHIIYDTTSQEKSRVADDVIRAQLLLDSGHWYMLSEIQRSEANLNSLGTFDLFRIALDTNYINQIPDSLRDSSIVPMDVYLRMKLRAEIPLSIFGGTGSQGVVFGASAGFTDKNFSQAADNFNAQLSYQLLPLTQQRYSASIDYLRPYIGFGRVPLITGVGLSNQVQLPTSVPGIIPYSEFSLTAHVGSNFILSHTDNKTSLTPDILVAKITNTITFPDAGILAAQLVPRNDTLLFQHKVDSIHSSDSSIAASLPHQQINLLPSITYHDDRTNDIINPTSGDFLSASLEIGVPSPFLSDSSSEYVKFVPEVKYYYDLSNNGSAVLAGHLTLGYSYLMASGIRYHDPALDHRFYGGGGASERGWGEQSLLVSEDSNRAANLGGYNDFEGSLELRFAPFQYPAEFTSWQKLSSPIRVVLFYDAGNVWDQMAQVNRADLKTNQIAQSIGIGLRYITFFGALRIDWGFKLYDPSGKFNDDIRASTPTSQGAWLFSSARKGALVSFGNTCNIHFGLGQAF